MTINDLKSNEINQENKWAITDEDRKQIESQEENLTKIQSEKTEQKNIQSSQADFLKKKLNLNDWVTAETSESKIYWPAQVMMSHLADTKKLQTIKSMQSDWFKSLGSRQLSVIFWDIMNATDYKGILQSIKDSADRLISSDNTQSHEKWIKMVIDAQKELQNRNDEWYAKDVISDFLYLLNEAFQERYLSLHWDYYQTSERKEEIKKMKEKAKNVKVS